MTIDFHVHFFPDAIAPRAMASMTEKLGGRAFPVGDGTAAGLLAAMDAAGVDIGVLCPVATRPGQFDTLLRVSLAIRDGALGPALARRIVPLAGIHPADPSAEARLRAIADAGLKGVKLHPYYQGFTLDDPSLHRFFCAVRDCGLAVQCHCGADLGFVDEPEARCSPKRIWNLLKAVPGLRFCAAHAGGWSEDEEGFFDRLAFDTDCRADTAVLEQDVPKPAARRAVRAWPAEKLLFGTDFPWAPYAPVMDMVRKLRAPGELEGVFGANAAAFLGIDVPEATD